MTPEELAVQVGVAGYVAWSNCLIGHAPPSIQAYFERASHPQIGDLVVETSSFSLRMRDGSEPETCVGILVDRKVETKTFDPFDPEDEGEPETYEEEAWYIKVLCRPADAPACRWHNASFVAIPQTIQEHREFRGATE